MKHFIFMITLGLGALVSVTSASAQTPYTLQECIDYALKNNEQVQAAEFEQYIADAQVGQTRAQGLPQINGSAEVMHYYLAPKSFIPAQFFDPNATADQYVPVQFQPSFNGSAGITLNQILFDGSYFVGLQAAKTFKELSVKAKKRTEIDVVAAVSKAYYVILINDERLELIKQNYNRLDTLLTETKIMYENGFAEKIDINRVQVTFNNMKVERQNIERQMELAFYMLKFQMGMPIQEPIALAGDLEDIELEIEQSTGDNFNYENRIEYSELRTNQMLANLDLKNSRTGYYPSLHLFGSLGANMGTNQAEDIFNFSDRWFGNGNIGVRLNVPIFDGLLREKTIQQSRIRIQQIDTQFERMENSIDLEIQQARVNLTNAVSIMGSRKENLVLAQEVFEVAKIKYQEGVGSNLEVTEAESGYKEAETNYYSALYDALLAKVDLQKALGQLY